MNQIIKIIFSLFIFIATTFYSAEAKISKSIVSGITGASTCNWKSRLPYFSVWDSCASKTKNQGLINGYVYFNYSKASCFKYQWTINGVNIAVTRPMNYMPKANGKYTVCLKVTDTCSNCDTTFCKDITITCLSTSHCNWKSRLPYFSVWDSCASKSSNHGKIYGYIAFNYSKNTCFKYQWSVNGVPVSTSRYLQFTPNVNGKYYICMTVLDTCSHCDTTFCSSVGITCLGSSVCNWKSRLPYFSVWDSCASKTKNLGQINGYIGFNYSKSSCFKYQWTINGHNITTARYLKYLPTANGTYSVCMKVTDTCNHCDTTFCSTLTINCLSTSSCNWKSRNLYFVTWDSCNSANNKNHIYGYFGSAYPRMGCFRYEWKVNDTLVGNSTRMLNYQIVHNGYYKLCLKITDTCYHCDTTYCSTIRINCLGTTGVKAIENKVLISAFPNPANQEVLVQNDGETCIYSLTDINGRWITGGSLNSGMNAIATHALANGIYLISVKQGNVVGQQKIMILHE